MQVEAQSRECVRKLSSADSRTFARSREVHRAFVVVIALLLGLAIHAPAIHGQIVKSVETLGMTVSEMNRSVEFFSKVLSFEKVSDVELFGPEVERLQGVFGARMRVVRMKLGDEAIELTEYLTPRGRPIPLDSRSHDHWFQHIAIVVSDIDKAYAQLRAYNVRHTSTGPQRIPDWNQTAAGIRAFYFKDPDDHNLELIYFPPGKGDPKWQTKNGRLFLGIDHTAITVADTDRSLRFYRDILGMRVAGESENHGPEQERLNLVFGSRVRITGLRAHSGPGVEFLHYLHPADGRPTPADSRTNDLWHWQTAMAVKSVAAAAEKLKSVGGQWISSTPASPPEGFFGFKWSFLVRDADGHALALIEK